MAVPALPATGSDWTTWAGNVRDTANAAAVVTDIGTTGTATGDAVRTAVGTALPALIDPTPVTATDFGLTVPAGVRAYANATGQTIASGAYPVYLDLNATEYNEDPGLYSVDLTGNKITVTAAGLYLVSWDVSYANGVDLREAYITKNGGNALLATAAGAGGQAGRTAPLRLAANDYLQVICYVEGATVALTTSASHRCGLALHRIGL